MASFLNSIFGNKYPQTAKYEADQEKLRNDHKRFTDYENSNHYKRFEELDKLIHSGDFIKKVEILKTEKFKDTSGYRKLKDYKSLKKSKDLKDYFKYKATGYVERIQAIEQSDKLNNFADLKQWSESGELREAKSQKGFKKSDTYTKYKTFKKLKKDAELRFYFKQIETAKYKNYLNIDQSERLETFKKLKQLIESQEFINHKKELEDPLRFKKSKEYALISEYDEIKKTPEFKWYEKTKALNPFTEIDKWQITFEEDFDNTSIDKNKWINGYYWGKALLNDVYVLADEKQFFSDSNIQLRDSVANLTTKEGKMNGKVWDEKLGFVPKEFNYSSALLSTGQSFRQLFGKFEAKVRVDNSAPLQHAFWMVGETIAPQIDIFRFSNKGSKEFNASLHLMDKNKNSVHNTKAVNGTKFDSDFFIYGLEWTKNSLSWFVNGVKVHEQTQDIPQQPMYLVFSSHLMEENDTLKLPASLSIDWVKCYQKRE